MYGCYDALIARGSLAYSLQQDSRIKEVVLYGHTFLEKCPLQVYGFNRLPAPRPNTQSKANYTPENIECR